MSQLSGSIESTVLLILTALSKKPQSCNYIGMTVFVNMDVDVII